MALPLDRKDLSRAVKGAATSDDPLDRLVAAVQVQAELEALGTELVRRYVAKARGAGLSWARIGEALGVTKQAVQQRFTDRPATGAGDGGTDAGARAAGQDGDGRSSRRGAKGGGRRASSAALSRAAVVARQGGGRAARPGAPPRRWPRRQLRRRCSYHHVAPVAGQGGAGGGADAARPRGDPRRHGPSNRARTSAFLPQPVEQQRIHRVPLHRQPSAPLQG